MLASRASRLSNAGVQNQTTSDSLQQLLEMPRKSWWARLPFGVRMTAGTSALLITIGGGVAGIAALTKDQPDGKRIVTAVGEAVGTPPPPAPPSGGPPVPQRDVAKPQYDPAGTPPRISDQADRTGARAPRPPGGAARTAGTAGAAGTAQRTQRTTAVPPPARATVPHAVPPRPTTPDAASNPARPVVTTRTEVERREVPFPTQVVRDPTLPRGARLVQQDGAPGQETLRYLVTYTDGRPTDRKLLDITTTRRPQPRIIAYGSRRGNHGHGRGGRDCGKAVDLCLPLGRSAACAETIDPAATAVRGEATGPAARRGGATGPAASAVRTEDGPVTLLDQDVDLPAAEALDGLACTALGPR